MKLHLSICKQISNGISQLDGKLLPAKFISPAVHNDSIITHADCHAAIAMIADR